VGEAVAQFQWTVLISAKRIVLLTNYDFNTATVESEGTVTDEKLKALLEIDLASISQKKKNQKK